MSKVWEETAEYFRPHYEVFNAVRAGTMTRREGRTALTNLLRTTGRDDGHSATMARTLLRRFCPTD
jgi:hypothetical protein